jgi:hypothetical protein
MTPDEFAARVKSMADLVGGNSTRLVRRVALAVDTTVVMGTPVLTGRARANWQVGLGAALSLVKYPTPQKPSSPDAGATEAMSEGGERISGYSGQGDIHITNNLPYIKRLNDGYSSQAPAGYVEAGVAAAHRAIDTAGSILTNVVTEKI